MTEILHIFFGIHIVNMGLLARREAAEIVQAILIVYMWNVAFTGVVDPIETGNEKTGSDTKPTILNR